MTKLEREQAELQESREVIEEVLQTGDDDAKKGAEAVRHYEGVREKARRTQEDNLLSDLEEQRNRRFGSYKTLLAKTLVGYLQMLDWIKGWKAHVLMTDGSPLTIYGKTFETQDGILLVVATRDGRVFHQGILLSCDPVVDYMAIQTLAVATENQIDHEKGLLLDRQPQSDPGILGADGKSISPHHR